MPQRSKAKKDGAFDVDSHVGARIKARRILMRTSQDELGKSIGVTFQQIQKYESGHNRVSASMLWRIGQKLGVPTSYFFEEIDVQAGGDEFIDPMTTTEATDLVAGYNKLTEDQKAAVRSVIKAMKDRE